MRFSSSLDYFFSCQKPMHVLSIKITVKMVCLTVFHHTVNYCFNMLFDFLKWMFINQSSFLPYLPVESCKQVEYKRAFKDRATCLTLIWNSWNTRYTTGKLKEWEFALLQLCVRFKMYTFDCGFHDLREQVLSMEFMLSEFLDNGFKAIHIPTYIPTQVWSRRPFSSYL